MSTGIGLAMAAHESVKVSIEQDSLKRFRQSVGQVHRGINSFELDEIASNPLLDCEIADIHMTGALCWLAGVGHQRAAALSS
jgi:hypothetical protein